jgi:hypothetical protein
MKDIIKESLLVMNGCLWFPDGTLSQISESNIVKNSAAGQPFDSAAGVF